MWRVVLDCGVLTSALLNPHGSPARLLDFALQGRLRLFATPRMVTVVSRVLRSDVLKHRIGMTDRELSRFLAELPVLLCLVRGGAGSHARCRIDGTTELLACAAQSHADFVVTSLPINATTAEQGGTHIVTAVQLENLVGQIGRAHL